jgi:multicomponent Na+:H+ antiporter subunit D
MTVQNYGFLSYNIGGFQSAFGIELLVNGQSAMMCFILTITLCICTIVALLNHNIEAKIMGFIGIAYSAFVGMAITADFFNLYVFFELSSIATYILVASNKQHHVSYKVGFDYLLIGSVAGIIILFGIMLIYAGCKSLNMQIVMQGVQQGVLRANGVKLTQAGYIFIIIGLVIKAGVFPFYMWITRAYIHSSALVSIFLAGCGTKIALFNIYKMNELFWCETNGRIITLLGNTLTVMAAIGIVAIGIMLVYEKNIKRFVAYSSVVQSCYIVMGIFTLDNVVFVGVMLQMFAHTISATIMFALMASEKYSTNSKIFNSNGWYKAIFIALIFNTAGYPATMGFAAKWFMLSGMYQGEKFLLYGFMIIASLIGMWYSFVAMGRLLVDGKAKDDISAEMKVVIFICIMGVAAISFGGGNATLERFFGVYNSYFVVEK